MFGIRREVNLVGRLRSAWIARAVERDHQEYLETQKVMAWLGDMSSIDEEFELSLGVDKVLPCGCEWVEVKHAGELGWSVSLEIGSGGCQVRTFVEETSS